MTFIICEAGVNHGGDFGTALQLARHAKQSGADAVKFQHFSAAALKRTELAPLELSIKQHRELAMYCQAIGIEYMCTPFGVPELDAIAPLVKRIKIASGCLRNHDLLYAAYQTGLPVILSTGMSTLAEVKAALGTLAANVTLLHCTSAYPCPLEDVNLNAMTVLRSEFGRPVGYSDHTTGITVAIAAAAKGAAVIENHLTLDRSASGPDHKSSIEPDEFRVMVNAIRDVEKALGDGRKRLMPSEEKVRALWP